MNTLNVIIETITNGYKPGILSFISLGCILFGISVIISKNPIVSVLFLITLFCSVSGYLITLGLHFIALSYLLVYVGAISILFLFILMLINVRISELITDNKNSIPLAIFAVLTISIPVYSILPFNIYVYDIVHTYVFYSLMDITLNNSLLWVISNNIVSVQALLNKIGIVTSQIWDGNLAETSHITSIGNIMYTGYFIWLILTSLILLLAMVGTIVITIKNTT